MGQELECRLRYRRRMLKGKAWLETDHCCFVGTERLKILSRTVSGVHCAAGFSQAGVHGRSAELELGASRGKVGLLR